MADYSSKKFLANLANGLAAAEDSNSVRIMLGQGDVIEDEVNDEASLSTLLFFLFRYT